jgi:NAD-dependent SIR2 family protein deacetylase
MKTSFKGHQLPESHKDARVLHAKGTMKYAKCLDCGLPLHTADAARTPAGWLDTQITGICEPCFDNMFGDDEELNTHE